MNRGFFQDAFAALGRAWTYLAERKAAWFFIAPPLVLLGILIIYPTIHLWSMALSRYDIAFMDGPEFIGLRNFVRMTTDQNFINAIKNTFILSIGSVVIEFLLGLGLALLLYEPLRGSTLVKPLLIIPMMIPPVVVGMNFRLILDTFGPMNGFLNLLNLPSLDWLGTPLMARLSIILTDVWQWSPFIFIILLAALNAIPSQLLDAAKVDGASSKDMFLFVIWPMILPSVAVALTFRFIDALKLFDIVYMLTFGGPADATVVVSLYVYRTAFRFGQFGYAAALGIVLLLFTTIVVFLVLRILRVEKRLGWEE
jgi:multiple sugar transport system permease protein